MKKQLASLVMLVALAFAMSASAEFPIEAKT
jgi:Na+(H+)/acetate symporter ActP